MGKPPRGMEFAGFPPSVSTSCDVSPVAPPVSEPLTLRCYGGPLDGQDVALDRAQTVYAASGGTEYRKLSFADREREVTVSVLVHGAPDPHAERVRADVSAGALHPSGVRSCVVRYRPASGGA